MKTRSFIAFSSLLFAAPACSGDDTSSTKPVNSASDTNGTDTDAGTGSGSGTMSGSSGSGSSGGATDSATTSATATATATSTTGPGTTGTGSSGDTGTAGSTGSSGTGGSGSTGTTGGTTGSTSGGSTGGSTGPGTTTGTGSTGGSTGSGSGSGSGGSSGGGAAAWMAAVTSGDGQMPYIDQQAANPVLITVTDGQNMPVSGADVDFISPLGAVTVPTTGQTDINGEVLVLARVGRAIQNYQFTADVQGSPATVNFDASAVAPPDGTALTLVNVSKSAGNNVGVPGSGTAAQIGAVRGVAVASDDTVYIGADQSNNGFIYALDAVGHMTVVAGGGGDESNACIDATTADLGKIEDVLLDENNDLIYLSASYNGGWRVLTIDLVSGLLCTVAGGNEAAAAPQYGDGGLATDAKLVAPGDISLGPDDALYIADRNVDRIRRVSGGVIDAWLTTGSCNDPIAFTDCGTTGCEMLWDSGGNLFLNARICGDDPGGTTDGIVRIDPGNGMAMEHVAGRSGGSAAEPVLSTDALMDGLGGMAFDEAGNLYVVEGSGHRIRRIDTTSWRIETVMNNTGAAGTGIDYNPAVGVALDTPKRIAFNAVGDLFIADSGNNAVRLIWGLGETASLTANLGKVSGDLQNIEVDRKMALHVVDLQDDQNTPLEGLQVRFSADDSGACVDPAKDLTDDQGLAATFARPGLAVGGYTYTAAYTDIHGVHVAGSPVSFSATAIAPSDGDILTIVNTDHTSGELNVPGAGTCARVGGVRGVTTASDGRVFFTDNVGSLGRVRVLDAVGHLETIAGGGASQVDGVPALDASISNIRDTLFDEANNRLFLTGTYGSASRILRVNLAQNPPFLYIFAGQGTTKPMDGDGGLATESHLSGATDIAIDPTNASAVYVVDAGHGRIRKIASLVIEHFYGTADGDCAMDVAALQSCTNCNMAWDASGNAFVSGQICGSGPGGNTPGIIKLVLDNTDTITSVEHVAGNILGTEDWNGVAGASAKLNGPGGLLVGSDGHLYFAESAGHKVGQVNSGTGVLTLIAGDGTAGSTGDYAAAASARVDQPHRLAERLGGDLVISDRNNSAIRLVWGQFP